MSVGYTKFEHILRAQAHRAWQDVGWECVEWVPLGGMPDLDPSRKRFTSWPSLWNSMGKGQKIGEGMCTLLCLCKQSKPPGWLRTTSKVCTSYTS